MSSLITANGKEIKVVPNGRGYFKLQFATGGELPEDLSGIYTSSNLAYIEAVKYVERSKEKAQPKKSTKEE
jgi:hypothetical protein